MLDDAWYEQWFAAKPVHSQLVVGACRQTLLDETHEGFLGFARHIRVVRLLKAVGAGEIAPCRRTHGEHKRQGALRTSDVEDTIANALANIGHFVHGAQKTGRPPTADDRRVYGQRKRSVE